MAYARLRIEKYLEGEHLAGGAIVDVRRLDKGRSPNARVTRTTAPMGWEGSGAESRVNLDPGTYEFTAILPSGDVLSRVTEVDARAEGVPVVFDMGHSAHEWMSWQHALGNVVGDHALQVMHAQGANVRWLLVDDVDAQLFAGITAPDGPDALAMTLADHLAHAPGHERVPFNFQVPMHLLSSQDDPPYKVYRILPGSPFNYEASAFARRYALVSDGSNRQMLCVLPYPWRKASGDQAIVELLVGPDQPLDADKDFAQPDVPWSVSTIARDDQVASVLSYFAAGDDSAAAFLATTALDLLFGKMVNPLAASAGAYVLVDQWLRQRETDPQAVKWLSWIDNLAKWFPWLPDGEILRGWIALTGRAGKPSVEAARRAFVEAERRGIPVYAAGVRRLADGLARIANQDRAEGREDRLVIDALERTRRVAWSTDPRFPFTTIRLWVAAS
jgi:hypothetical protein